MESDKKHFEILENSLEIQVFSSNFILFIATLRMRLAIDCGLLWKGRFLRSVGVGVGAGGGNTNFARDFGREGTYKKIYARSES